jgi:hypothetical protein
MVDLDFDALREARRDKPAVVAAKLTVRQRRPVARGDKKLFFIAADHPARGALGVRRDEMAMANRYDLLERVALALSRPGVDGLLGTADILEDLALLGVLDDKLVVASMNRGGLQGASFELDDRFTAWDIAGAVGAGVDFAKLLLRIDLADPGSVDTLATAARAVTEAAIAGLPIMLEPFICSRVDGILQNDLTTEAVIKSVAIASGLGSSSSYSWLKLPVVPEMERVMLATTLPTLLLGGDPSLSPDEIFSTWRSALGLPGVHGLVAGRTLLYPPDGDVAAAVDVAASLVHSSPLDAGG